MLHEYSDGNISLKYNGNMLRFSKLYDKVEPIEQGKVVPNERLDFVLEFIKEKQKGKEYKRSTRCPGKRHLDLPNKQDKLTNTTFELGTNSDTSILC